MRRIKTELTTLGCCLPGSVVVRKARCGKANCSCHADPPRLHGPFRSWTRKVRGKTVIRLLTQDQLADYQPYFDNDGKLKQLVQQLEKFGLQIADTDPRNARRT